MPEQRAVRLVDLPGLELFARPPELRSGCQDGSPRAPGARHLGDTCGGQRADLRSSEQLARLHDHVAETNVPASRANVLSSRNRVRDLDLVVLIDNSLELNDRVGPFRDRPTGRDPHRLAGLERSSGRLPRGDPIADGQPAGGIAGPEGKAVHRRAVERRQIHARRGRLGQHAPGGCVERDRLGLQRASALENQALRLLDGQERSHLAHKLLL